MFAVIGKITLVISLCYEIQVSGNEVCSGSKGTNTKSDKLCTQICAPHSTCDDFQCSDYNECRLHCSGHCNAVCTNSTYCDQSCNPSCSGITCNSTQCSQICHQCSKMVCNSMKKCSQQCNTGKCDNMMCRSNTSCIQSGYGDMKCESENCKQTCSKSNCLLTCNARICHQKCVGGGCDMTCSLDVEECTQNCTNGSCSFNCDENNTKCIRICPQCRSGGVKLSVVKIAYLVLVIAYLV